MNETVTEVEESIERILAGAQERYPAAPVIEERSAAGSPAGAFTTAVTVAAVTVVAVLLSIHV